MTLPKNTSVSLGEHFEGFVASQIESGRYASASEVIREGLRLVEERQQRRQALHDAIVHGRESGISTLTI